MVLPVELIPYEQVEELLIVGGLIDDDWQKALSECERRNPHFHFSRMFGEPSKYRTGGQAPIELEGTIEIAGKRHEFYFRSRWSTAYLNVGKYPELEDEYGYDLSDLLVVPRFRAGATVSTDDYGASWLNPTQSVLILLHLFLELKEFKVEECRSHIQEILHRREQQ